MNSLRYTVKHLRFLNIKKTLQVAKECVPNLNVGNKSEIGKILASVENKNIVAFSPRSIGLEIGEKPLIGKIQQEPIKYVPIVNPRSILPLVEDQWKRDEVGLPSVTKEEKQAARLIVIRKKKMKKHQRRKLWKRMRHRWARVKQRRRQIKEKIFQNELLAMVKEANEFSAEEYVRAKLERANYNPLPTRWKHKRLPQFIIRQLMGIDKKINYKHNEFYKA